jgi:hypothetical protein
MEKQEKIVEIIYNSYQNIDFINRYKSIYPKYFFDIDIIMKKMDKKENLKILKELGYSFKIFTPGQYYNYEEKFDNIKLILSSQISGGIISSYIYIYIKEENIDHKYNYEQNLGFVYKKMTNDYNQIVNALCFRDYDDFREIMASLIEIYEDFKKEFLKLLIENNLLVE